MKILMKLGIRGRATQQKHLGILNACWRLWAIASSPRPMSNMPENVKPNLKVQVLVPNPYTSFQNWMFGFMVRGYFQQEFDLSEFKRACPLVCLSMLDKLSNNKFDELDGLLKPECAQKVVQNWEELQPHEQKIILRSEADDLNFMRPKLRMRMPDRESGAELKAFLNIQISMVQLLRTSDWATRMPPINPNWQNMPMPVQHMFEFEREVTRGVEGSWSLEDCGFWPLPKFVL